MEDGASAISPVVGVIAVAALGSSWVAWHGRIVLCLPPEGKQRCPLFGAPMPANFGEQIQETDFNNLLAYLLTLQSKPDKPSGK
jgi:hypothetical protein